MRLVGAGPAKGYGFALEDGSGDLLPVLEEVLDPLVLAAPLEDHAGAVSGFHLRYVNQAACQEAWATAEELLDSGLERALPGFLESNLPAYLAGVLATGEPYRGNGLVLEGLMAGRSTSRVVDLRAVRTGQILAITWRDVTGFRHAGQALERLGRTRILLAATGRAISRIRSRGRLLAEVCRIAVEVGGFRMAWAGLVDPASGEVRPAASQGHVCGYLDGLQFSLRQAPENHGPTVATVRTGRPVVCEDIALDPRMTAWKERALERGYRASAALPLRGEGRIVGCLNLYAGHVDSFHREDMELLEAMAEDLSFALRALEQDERKQQAERALAQTNEILENLFATMDFAVAFLGRDFQLLRVNQAYATRISARTRQELAGRNHFDLEPDDHARAHLHRVLQTGESYLERARPLVRETTTWWDWTAQRILDHQGEPSGILLCMANVTDRELAVQEVCRLNSELEHRVRQRTAELEEAVRDLEAFSGMVSHDLRSPLQVIAGYVSVLETNFLEQFSGETRVMLGRISEAVDRVAALIEDLLVFARSGRVALVPSEVELGPLVREVVDEARGMEPPDRRVEVAVGELGTVRADASLLRNLVANLIGNAFKYTRPRSVSHLGIGREGDVFFVRDNGVGFDPAQAEKIFQPFERLHGREEFEGTGLGLAIVRRIARRHGGEAWAESTPGQGTTMRFRLS